MGVQGRKEEKKRKPEIMVKMVSFMPHLRGITQWTKLFTIVPGKESKNIRRMGLVNFLLSF